MPLIVFTVEMTMREQDEVEEFNVL
jgi:hypothetical protein